MGAEGDNILALTEQGKVDCPAPPARRMLTAQEAVSSRRNLNDCST